jgi:hypothetical protein
LVAIASVFLFQQTVVDIMAMNANEAEEFLALLCKETNPWSMGWGEAQPMFQFARDGTGWVSSLLLI